MKYTKVGLMLFLTTASVWAGTTVYDFSDERQLSTWQVNQYETDGA